LNQRWPPAVAASPPRACAIDFTDPTLDLLRGARVRQAARMLAHGHALTDDDLIICNTAGEPPWGPPRDWLPRLGSDGPNRSRQHLVVTD
jgi:hypothetical protein